MRVVGAGTAWKAVVSNSLHLWRASATKIASVEDTHGGSWYDLHTQFQEYVSTVNWYLYRGIAFYKGTQCLLTGMSLPGTQLSLKWARSLHEYERYIIRRETLVQARLICCMFCVPCLVFAEELNLRFLTALV